MSKNLTRKGIAFGALVALGSSLLAGAPATAAGIDNGYVSLAPNTGTSYSVLADGTFDLKSNVVGSLAGTTGKDLKFFVEDLTSKTKFDADTDAQAATTLASLSVTAFSKSGNIITFTMASGAPQTGASVYLDAADVTAIAGGTAVGWYAVTTVSAGTTFSIDTGVATAASSTTTATLQAADTSDVDERGAITASALGNAALIGSTVTVASTIGGTATTSGRLANGSYVVDTNTNANSVDRVLRLVNTDATVTTSVSVTAWVDDNDNGAIDPTEYQSPARTVTFLKNADLTVNTTIEGPVLGATGINGTVAITPELNGQQVGNATTAVTTTWTLQASSVNTNTATYNTTSKVWDVAMDLNGSDVVVVGTYSVRASVAGVAIGNTATGVAGARTAADTKIVVSASNDATYVKNVDASVAGSSTIRKGKSATVVITAYDQYAKALGAGKSVTVDYSSATTTTDWTVNGTKVLDNAATATKVYTTDANGQVTLAVSSTEGLANDTVTIEARPENVAAAGNAANAKVALSWAAATYTIVDLNNAANGTAQNVTKGGSVTFDLFAGDQWNAPLTGAYRLYVTATGRTSAGANVDFAAGRASYTVTDAALGSGSTITFAAQLQKQTSGTWANSTDATALSNVTITTSDAPATSLVPALTFSAGTTVALNTTAIAAYNAETTQGDFTDPSGVAYGIITLGAGSGVSAGDVVTVSGSGLFFGYYDASATAITRVGSGSLSFVLDNASDTVRVFANKYAKDTVVTVSSRGRSGTVKVTTGVASHDSAADATITAPISAPAGGTFKVSAKLADLFGNGVKVVTADASNVAVSYSGPGIVFGTLPTETDANGELSFAVLLGSADKGAATVTVSYDLNNDGDYTDTDEFVVSKTIYAALSAKVTKAATSSAVVKNAKGATIKLVRGSKSKTVVATSASQKVTLKGGTGTVKVYVNGVKVASK